MTALTAAGPTAVAASAFEARLLELDPSLGPGFRANLDRARDVVTRRVLGAIARERLVEPQWSGERAFLAARDGGYMVARARRHGFGRIELAEPLPADPALVLRRLLGRGEDVRAVARELTDATVNLALAYARPSIPDDNLEHDDDRDHDDDGDADRQCVAAERLATEGHNLHPCGRTRLGWGVADLLAHDLESPGTHVGFVGVRRDVHIGDDVGRTLLPDAPLDPAAYAVVPVHAWQLDHVVRRRYATLIADGVLVPLPDTIPAVPTAALRTLLLPEHGYLKLSLDIQVTSTRRTISVASTRNGPALSRLLAPLLGERVLLLAETAGSATRTGARERDLAAIVRTGLSGRLDAGERPVPGGALYATSPATGRTIVAGLVDQYAATRGLTRPGPAALSFVDSYARLLLPPVLELATRHGIGLEAHLQNCIPTFAAGVPVRLGLRDLAGLRLYPPRLAAPLELWPGSVIEASTVDVMRAKVAYTVLQAHLGEIIVRLTDSHDLDEPAAWRAVRQVVDEVYDRLRSEPGLDRRAAADHAFLTAATVPHKALLGMRLADARGVPGDAYVGVANPLHRPESG